MSETERARVCVCVRERERERKREGEREREREGGYRLCFIVSFSFYGICILSFTREKATAIK